MAVQLFSHDISDLCLGKPPLRPLPASAAVADALSLFRRSSGDPSLSVWSSPEAPGEAAKCIGLISIVDVLCFLCKEENISKPSVALHSPVSLLLPEGPPHLVKQLDPTSSILDAVDCILEGAQSLIVPRRSRNTGSPRQKPSQKPSVGRTYCWITQEDIIRFIFNSINHFSPIPFDPIQSLNIVEEKIPYVQYANPAVSALRAINSLSGQAAVAVVDDEGRLVGEISLYTLAYCDKTVAPGVATLSAGDLMAYIDYGGPPEDLIQLVKTRLEERKFNGMLELLEDDNSTSSVSSCLSSSQSSSSDDEVAVKSMRSRSNSLRLPRGTEPIVCHPGSSLIAVMIQALSHRLNHVWVVEEDYSLVGIVTFTSMLKAFRDCVNSFS